MYESPATGLRFSVLDGLVLAVAALATRALREPVGELAWSIPVVLGHFFLFCNVFRVRRSLELIWSALFLANVGAALAGGAFGWAWVLGLQAPVTLAVLAAEWRSPGYHGILAGRPGWLGQGLGR